MLGGGGKGQDMLNSIRNNKNLLRKKNIFKRERTFLQIKKEYLKATKGEIELKKATKRELAIVRQRVINESRKETSISAAIAIVVLCFFSYLSVQLFKSPPVDNSFDIQKEREKHQDFLFYISDGDKWFKKQKWHNAIFQYKKALELYPNDYGPSYRLALAYFYQCKSENEGCDECKILLIRLLKAKPNDPDLIELNQKFKTVYGLKD